jgi:subtilisin family serine protease
VSSQVFSALLVRLPEGTAGSLPGLDGGRLMLSGGVRFELHPLFSVPASTPAGPGFAGSPGWEWHIARPTQSLKGAHAWELAHSALQQNTGLSASGAVYVEPDILQSWGSQSPSPAGLQLTPGPAATACAFEDQMSALPSVQGRFAWHLDDDFSQLRAARNAAASSGANPQVRIAHLDTGYNRQHTTFPAHMRLDLQRNFMDDQASDDAHDPATTGLLNNPGHGTATLALLAGNRYVASQAGYQFNDFVGGAPDAEIVPIRVGTSVVQILTSSVASGIHRAAELCSNHTTAIHVLSMSMGGLASTAWADAVDFAYESGIVLVTAAGNNFSAGFFGFPTHFIVYPARFRRVLAACGIMANRAPYYGLSFHTMQGNWGPHSKMATALSAYTPNTCWAKLGCEELVNMDSEGTSTATPQIAAAAALYLQKYASTLLDPAQYPEPWMRVEAVRRALFSSADKSADGGSVEKLGNGILQASRAIAQLPGPASSLQKTVQDSATFPFLRVLTGVGIAASSQADAMLALEATQLAQQWNRQDSPNPLEEALVDPDLPAEAISQTQTGKFLEGIIDHPYASKQLKERAEHVRRSLFPSPPPSSKPKAQTVQPALTKAAPVQPPPFSPPVPVFRFLRGFSIDPSLSTSLSTVRISEVQFRVPWEKLQPGPTGEYVEVIDVDPGSACLYEPVNLDDPSLLAQGGLPPSEGTPQFHQQMAYAVSTLTIRNFERALGRRTLWRPGPSPDAANPKNDSVFVPRLRIYPHALREANAYYSPGKIALLFGYFNGQDDPASNTTMGMVFTCLSHDVVAHETTHALLDGMHRRFLNATNPDVLAFHEAFADIVALFQHFTIPEILRYQIANTRGDIRSQQNLLGQLAVQFGFATGLRRALRDAIGSQNKVTGEWEPRKPDPSQYTNATEPHDRGSILVAAVFDAFLSIYERRISDLLRLASGGTGILQPGAIHPDLVARLSAEAAKSAQHVLTMCIRALDYCPPVDITFGEYLRAVITADSDLVPDDDLNYRVSFIEAFRRRGIYPRDLRTLSVENLVWRSPEKDALRPSNKLESGLEHLRGYAQQYLYTPRGQDMIRSRERLFQLERAMRRELHGWLKDHFASTPDGNADARFLGLDSRRPFEVHTARFALRTSPDGDVDPQIIVSLLQQKTEPVDPSNPAAGTLPFEGGSAIVADLPRCNIRYCIRKNLSSQTRLDRQRQFAELQLSSARATYFGSENEPFAGLHRGM